MIYKNTSCIKKQFHGVDFNPGEAKEVNGYINDPKMIRLSTLPQTKPKVAKEPIKQKPQPVLEKEEPNKSEEHQIKEIKEDDKDGRNNHQ